MLLRQHGGGGSHQLEPGKGQNADASPKMHVLCGGPPGYPDPCEPRTRGRECSSICTISKLLLHLLAGSAGCGLATNTDSSGPSGHDSLGAALLDIGMLGATVQCLFSSSSSYPAGVSGGEEKLPLLLPGDIYPSFAGDRAQAGKICSLCSKPGT